jgi:hypothetical protein
MTSDGDEQKRSHSRPAGNGDMDLLECNTHSFIFKMWLEESAAEAGRATWRGHITHVLSGERSYVKELRDVTTFVRPYLERMGIRLHAIEHFRDWLGQVRARLGGSPARSRKGY